MDGVHLNDNQMALEKADTNQMVYNIYEWVDARKRRMIRAPYLIFGDCI